MANRFPLIVNTASGNSVQELPSGDFLDLSSSGIANSGNITVNAGSYFIGDGSQLTGIVSSYGNANVVANLAALGSNPVTTTANITGGNILTSGLISATGNITGSNLSAGTGIVTLGSIVNANANGVGNIGSSTTYFNTAFVKATSAQYADLAEYYKSDADYPPGTVVVLGGHEEITISNKSHDTRVAGVISTEPAYIMNSSCPGLPVALTGRVPCQVQGPVAKGDVLVTGELPGVAQRIGMNYQPGCVLGKSLEEIADNSISVIEVVVGRF